MVYTMRLSNIVLFTVLSPFFLLAQTPDSLTFFPAHAGDVRQYRSQFTCQVTLTQFFDKDSTDSHGDAFLWYHFATGETGIYEIDSATNLYELNSIDDTSRHPLLYTLNADSGKEWTYLKQASNDSIVANVVGISGGVVFGKQVTVKKITYTRYSDTGPFWLGTRYLATGFGFIQWDIEPSDVYVLSGAVINGRKYGTVVSVQRDPSVHQAFDLISNYPNPFNNSTIIAYSISDGTHVNITICDVLGRALKTLVDERKQKRRFEINFEATGMTTGPYFAVMKTNTNTLIHKMLYLK